MKILIGYDGSDCADAAIDDLQRAGIPANSEIMVVTGVDMWPHVPPSMFQMDAAAVANASLAIKRAHHLAEQAMGEAKALAARGEERARKLLADATVSHGIRPEAPATALISAAEEWKADLIVVGSHGMGALEKWVLGSVSQAVVSNARCSVRVARKKSKPAGAGLRLVVGVDGSPNSAAAVQAITMRQWPPDTHVLTVVALDMHLAVFGPLMEEGEPKKGTPDFPAWVREMADGAIAELHHAGLTGEPALRFGDAKGVLVEEAKLVDADCIFVGARGRSRVERLLIGSVSAAVCAKAPCSVEVIRSGGQ